MSKGSLAVANYIPVMDRRFEMPMSRRAAVRVLTTMVAGIVLGSVALAFSPSNVECIAPSAPGGGWDFTCREIGKILYDLKIVPQPVKVVNMSGADGGVAYSYVVSKENTNPDLLVAASTATASELARNTYGGLTMDRVDWVASLGADYAAISVAADSKYKTLGDLVSAVKADPSAVTFGGGSAAGAYDNLNVLQLMLAAGMTDVKQVKYVSFGSGGPALTMLLGHHVDAIAGDFSEITGQLDAGKVRVLAVMGPTRFPSSSKYADIPTATEQGFDYTGGLNWRGLYIPGGVTSDQLSFWGNALQKVYQSAEWKQAMAANGLAPFWQNSTTLTSFLKKQIGALTAVDKSMGLLK